VLSVRIISSSALLSLGLIEHGNGLGRLDKTISLPGSSNKNRSTHLTRPPEYVNSNGVPSESRRFSIWKTESTVAATINSVASAKCLPGQSRFPNPNIDPSVTSSRKVPFGLRNRSGLKTSGSGYTSGSRVIALRSERAVGRYR
jgi:phage-related tail fiber protein